MSEQARCGGVLVVDDDADILEATQMVLEHTGYRVLTASNGEQALQLLREQRPRPCLILLDLMMPVMDGWRFRAEQERDPELAGIPVVVLSGDGDTPQKAATLHAAEHIMKPISLDRLIAVARKYDQHWSEGGKP